MKEGDLTIEEWNQFLEAGEFEDITSEMKTSFLMIYQTMRGRIKIDEDKFDCIGWHQPGADPFVRITKVI